MKWNNRNVEQYEDNESEEFDKQLQELKIESKFEKRLQVSIEELKSYSQNNHWLKKDDDDDVIDYVWEYIREIKKPVDDEKN